MLVPLSNVQQIAEKDVLEEACEYVAVRHVGESVDAELPEQKHQLGSAWIECSAQCLRIVVQE